MQTNNQAARNQSGSLRPVVYGRTVYFWLNTTSVPRSVSRKWVRRFLRFRMAQRQLSGFLKLVLQSVSNSRVICMKVAGESSCWQKKPTADKAAITSIRSELVNRFDIFSDE